MRTMTDNNEFKRFVVLVKDMRRLQKKYFECRTYDTLIIAKNAESAVDREIKRISETLAASKEQPGRLL